MFNSRRRGAIHDFFPPSLSPIQCPKIWIVFVQLLWPRTILFSFAIFWEDVDASLVMWWWRVSTGNSINSGHYCSIETNCRLVLTSWCSIRSRNEYQWSHAMQSIPGCFQPNGPHLCLAAFRRPPKARHKWPVRARVGLNQWMRVACFPQPTL